MSAEVTENQLKPSQVVCNNVTHISRTSVTGISVNNCSLSTTYNGKMAH